MSDRSWSTFMSTTYTPNLRSACPILRRLSSWALWSLPLPCTMILGRGLLPSTSPSCPAGDFLSKACGTRLQWLAAFFLREAVPTIHHALFARLCSWYFQNYNLSCLWYSSLGFPHHWFTSHCPWSLRSCQELGQLALSTFLHSCLLIPLPAALSQVFFDEEVSAQLWHEDQYYGQCAHL